MTDVEYFKYFHYAFYIYLLLNSLMALTDLMENRLVNSAASTTRKKNILYMWLMFLLLNYGRTIESQTHKTVTQIKQSTH